MNLKRLAVALAIAAGVLGPTSGVALASAAPRSRPQLSRLPAGCGWPVGYSSRKMLGLWARRSRKPPGRWRGAGIPAAVQGIRTAAKLTASQHPLRATEGSRPSSGR